MPKLNQKDNSLRSITLPKRKKNRRKVFVYWLKIYKRRFYLRIKKLKGNPNTLARGVAVGVFAGCFPFFGLQSLIGVLLATIFKGSRVAAIACTWISNPITYIPLFVFNFNVGKFFLRIESISGRDIDFESLSSFMELGSAFAIALLSGSFIVGAIASLIAYFASLAFFKRLQRERLRRSRKLSQRNSQSCPEQHKI